MSIYCLRMTLGCLRRTIVDVQFVIPRRPILSKRDLTLYQRCNELGFPGVVNRWVYRHRHRKFLHIIKYYVKSF